MTTAQYHKHFINQLKTIYEEREATQIAEWVFENITELKKWQIRMGQHEIDAGILGKLNGCLGDLLLHKPVQYVLSEAWFYKRLFFVNENVLIPRPETEDIVARIVEDLQLRNIVYPLILDIGTGSGCIAVSLSKELVESSVTAIDVSNGALNVARQNAANLDAVIDFLLIDFLEPKGWTDLKKYDVIVSNPPYIPVKEKASLAKNVISFEPHNALFVPDDDPFIFYKYISDFSTSHLKQNGIIYVEIHEDYAREVQEIFRNSNFIAEITKDFYGKERIIKATRTL